jgi:hypothetical protein
MAVPQKDKHSVTNWTSSYTPSYVPKRVENKCQHKNCIRMFILVSIIIKTQKQYIVRQLMNG